MLFALLPNTLTQEQRIRTLTNWYVHDWGDGEYSIVGWVTHGNEPGDGERIRSTRTSPIQYRVGKTLVVTQSDSEYLLDKPAKHQDPNQILELFKEH